MYCKADAKPESIAWYVTKTVNKSNFAYFAIYYYFI